ncbi:MAG: hypothetical protein VB142_05780 [Burkholderia sp.]
MLLFVATAFWRKCRFAIVATGLALLLVIGTGWLAGPCSESGIEHRHGALVPPDDAPAPPNYIQYANELHHNTTFL